MRLPGDEGAATRIKHFYETLSPESLARIGTVYSESAWFKDPFNEVTGLSAITAIFQHMFDRLDDPRFLVGEMSEDAQGMFLTWVFEFGAASQRTRVRGATHIRLDAEGKIVYHRDYWDPAEELYEKIPVLGSLMRFLKRRLSS